MGSEAPVPREEEAASGPQFSSELSRELSLFHITMMGMGMMIGAGVFLGIGKAVKEAGPGGVILTFALGGLLAIFTAMSYAELSSAIPRAGGAYNFARVGFGRGTSFMAGWMEWFASSVAGSMYAVTFAIYTLRYLAGLGLLPWTPEQVPAFAEKSAAALVACLFLYINYRGASETGRMGVLFTFGQTLFLVFIGLVGLVVVVGDPSRLQNFKPFMPNGWSRLLVTMGFTYVAFEGYEVIAQAGDETIDPRRNLPKAMLYSVFIVTLTYAGVAFATVVAVKTVLPGFEGAAWQWIGSFEEKGFGEAVSQLPVPAANLLLTLAVIFASTSALNATIFSATRASYALGRDKMLPSAFARISRKRKTPWVALAFTGLIVLLVATVIPETKDVAYSASMMFLLLFFLVNLCVIKIRRNMEDELRYGFLMPLFPLFPVLAILLQAVLAAWAIHMSPIAWGVAAGWVFSGVVIYHAYSKKRTVTTAGEILVFEEERAPEGDEYRIMVAMANPKNALEMVRTTYRISEAKKARVELLHMVPVPEAVPLSDAEKYMLEGKEAVAEVMMYLVGEFPVGTTLRYCRNVARGIVTAVREKKTDMLIMGWRGRPTDAVFHLGSTVDPVIERVPCDVVVLKDCANREFRKVLVPVGGGPNGALALEMASILADPKEGEVVALTVSRAGVHFDAAGFISENQERLRLPKEKVWSKVIAADNIIDAILKEAEDYDLVVLGATRQPLLYKVAWETVPEAIARRTSKPLVMVKAATGISSLVKRWI